MAFYIVFSAQGETPPKVQHETHGAAKFAAERMAKLNPGREFFVMKSVSKPFTAAEAPQVSEETATC
jgi:hypothetical protein